MRICKLSDVVIKENRQRQEFEAQAMEELRASIENSALQNAPVLREENGQLVLVAGERRLRTIKDIFELGGHFRYDGRYFTAEKGEIPYTSLGDLNELEAEEAELDENLKRKDLTWQELASAHNRLHKLRAAQKEQYNEAVDVHKQIQPQTVADTAKEVFGRSDGDYQDIVRKELIVAKHLDNPAVAAAKDVKEAFKILKREEERAKNIELAKEVGKELTVDRHQIWNGNCLEWMQDCIDSKTQRFDVIVTDPPYGMGADQFGDAGGKMTGIEHHYDDSYEAWLKLMRGYDKRGKDDEWVHVPGWCELAYKIAKPQAHCYVFCDFDRFHELKGFMERAGWEVFRTPLIVHKRNSGRVPLPERGPRRQYELVLFANKGRMPCTNIYPDVISVDADDNTGHGAQKPVALYQNLLQRSVRPGMNVGDFFAGSGPMLEAAHTMKCYATLVEQNPEYYAKCLKRAADLRKLEEQMPPV